MSQRLEIAKSVVATLDVVSAVISDFVVEESEGEHHRTLIHLDDRSDYPIKTIRGRLWNETKRSVEDLETASVIVDGRAVDNLTSDLKIEISLEEKKDGVTIRLELDYIPKFGFFGEILDGILIKPRVRRRHEALLNAWALKIHQGWEFKLSRLVGQP